MRKIIVILMLATSVAMATTIIGERGPPALLRKKVDMHLFDVYVTPPPSSSTYKPGKIEIYLTRMYPEHLMAQLVQERLPDGRIHVHFAISPEREASYFIRVSDLQPTGKYILLNEDKLTEIQSSSKK